MPDVHLEVISFFLRGRHGQGEGEGETPMEGDIGRSAGVGRLRSLMNTHNTNPYLLSLSLTCLVNVRTGPYGAAGANNWLSRKWRADHLCTRRDVFRASMLVEALLMLVESDTGSGYKSRAVWTGGFENCCLLSPGGLALLGPCG